MKYIRGGDYGCIVDRNDKSKAINVLQKNWFDQKMRNIKEITFLKNITPYKIAKQFRALGNVETEKLTFYF